MVVSFKSCLGKRNRSRLFPRGPLGFVLGKEMQVSALLWLGWPSQHTGPEDPEPPTCCHPTETIAVTQRTHCSRMAASSPNLSCPATGPPVPRSPPFPGKNPAGWVVAQAEERPHQQDDYNLGHRTDLHVLVPSSSHSAHWQGGLKLCFSFFLLFVLFQRWVLVGIALYLLGTGWTDFSIAVGVGGAPATKQTLFLVLFLFSKTDEPDGGACPLRGGVTWLPWPLPVATIVSCSGRH